MTPLWHGRVAALAGHLDLVPLAAVQAVRVGRVAVQLDHLVVGDAAVLVQPVDVLGDHGAEAALLGQLGERAVASVGLGLQHRLVGRELAAPRLATRHHALGRAHDRDAEAGGEHAAISQLTIEPDHTGLNRIESSHHRSPSHQPCQVLPLAALQLGQLALAKIESDPDLMRDCLWDGAYGWMLRALNAQEPRSALLR